MKREAGKREPRPEYADAAERFLALMAARTMSKARLSRESGATTNKLTHYETGQRAPGDLFKPRSEFIGLARALSLLPSALVAWWAFGEDLYLPAPLRMDIERFRNLAPADQVEALKLLGWGLSRGGKRKIGLPRGG